MSAKTRFTHQKIKAFYLLSHTAEEWQAISRHPGAFNQVWRRMLNLPPSPKPPPS